MICIQAAQVTYTQPVAIKPVRGILIRVSQHIYTNMKKIFVKKPVSQGEDDQNLFKYCDSQWFLRTAQTGRELAEVNAKPNIKLPIR
jgi:hypothetical protein